jgi:pyruvate formate lyase activating enzyme
MPLVPGLNDGPDELSAVADLLRGLGEEEIWVMPYHRLGESKLPKLDSKLKPLGIDPPTADRIRARADVLESAGLRVRSHVTF